MAKGIDLDQLDNIALSDERIYYSYKIDALTRFMQSEGIAPEITLANTGLSQDTLSLLDTRTSIHQLATVFRNMQAQGIAALALRAGKEISVSNYGLYGYALLSSTSLRKTLQFSIRYHKLATPTTAMALDDNKEYASFSFTDALGVAELRTFNLEFQLSLVFSLFRDIVGSNFKFDSVHLEFSKPEPEHVAAYQKILKCPAYFDQPRTEFRFSKNILDKPLLKSNEITESMVNELCDNLLKEQAQQSDLTRNIYELLIKDPTNMPSSEGIANTFAMTSRTLRRKLESRGTSYQAIVDEVRKELSLRFLRETKMSIEDIAEHVGFSDAANFRNAFKRWTGKTPGMYRP